jgi:hypothetical protein
MKKEEDPLMTAEKLLQARKADDEDEVDDKDAMLLEELVVATGAGGMSHDNISREPSVESLLLLWLNDSLGARHHGEFAGTKDVRYEVNATAALDAAGTALPETASPSTLSCPTLISESTQSPKVAQPATASTQCARDIMPPDTIAHECDRVTEERSMRDEAASVAVMVHLRRVSVT